MNTFPRAVESYLENLMSADYPAYLLVSGGSTIAEAGGSLAHFGLENLDEAENLYEQLPLLEGVLPANERLILPFIQLNEECYAEVHVFADFQAAPDLTWVIFVDASMDGAENQNAQQRRLSRALAKERGLGQHNYEPNIAWRILSQMEIATFESQTTGGFWVIGELPAWLQAVESDLVDEGWCWPAQHPYLQSFLEQANEVWDDEHSRPARSPVWTESSRNGDVYLQAIALRAQGKRILVLERLSRSRAEQTINAQRVNSSRLVTDAVARMRR